MDATDQARKFRINHRTPAGEPPVAVFARGIIDDNGDTVETGQGLAAPFRFTGTITKTTAPTGSILLSSNPTDGQTYTISDGTTAKVFEFDSGVAAVGTLTFTGQPSDADTFTLSDGVTTKVFEFEVSGGVTGGHVSVTRGTTTALTCTALITAINAVTGPAFLFVASQGAGTTVTLTANTRGTAGNAFTMAKSGTNLAVSGSGNFAGGLAAGSGPVTGSNIAVAISTTAALTAANLNTAINSASYGVTSTVATATLTLTGAGTAGTTGNVAITTTTTGNTTSGMAGGTDNLVTALLADSGVPFGKHVAVTGFTLKVNGATSWNDAATVKIEDNNGNIFATIAKAALTGNAVVTASTSNVTLGAAWFATGDAGKGLQIVLSSNEATGSPLLFQVTGQIS